MLAGNDNIHESLDEFEIQSDLFRDHRVSCSWASKNRCCPFFSFHSCGHTQEIVRGAFTGPLVLWLFSPHPDQTAHRGAVLSWFYHFTCIFLIKFLYGENSCWNLWMITANIFSVKIFRTFMVYYT